MANLRTSAAYRIAFTYAAALAAAILLLGVAVYFAADAEFRHQRDERIAAELSDLAQESGGTAGLQDEIAERERGRTTEPFGYALFDSAGRRIAGRMDTTRPAPGFSMIVFRDPVEGPDSARAKAVDLPSGARLVVAVDSEAVEAIDATILELFGIAFAIVLLIGLVGALLLGRYLRQRLGVISRTANAIVAGDLDKRMPVSAYGDEFDAAALALNAMLDRIAGLMDNLRQVSSDVAHDLRTPLLRLRSQLERVGKVDGAAERALEQGDALLALFGSILRIAEVEGGGLDHSFAMIDLSALVEDVADSFQPALSDSGHRFRWEVQPDISVRGNRELLAQALANLFDNARAHTPPGTQVVLGLSADAVTARISVVDNGPGVPPGEHRAILRRFRRGEASRTTPGNGLGLSLVAAVASAHGGEVVVSDAQPGLTVTITLPRLS
ncbi:HAMP domain-containing sensor histidine kinase [Sphingomonas sp. NFR15]|uniref:sensor histidine kinase n=1 Tax=Sphingomonas sp. NFR15 TaxID=1566282 RepID=UPI000881CCED|nr:HAMP domain-containing sensor histidine kinase [Sphingomonas sp. NFR15]SDA22323.1 Signal transduction histidine kinase [Sphingomonas sp. NFR15]